jgi:hypothetical protein
MTRTDQNTHDTIEAWRVEELGDFWCAHDPVFDCGPAIGYETEEQAVLAVAEMVELKLRRFALDMRVFA